MGQLKQLNKRELLTNKQYAFSMMLPKETKELVNMRDMFAFYNEQFYKEVVRMMSDKSKDYHKHFSKFASIQTTDVTEVLHPPSSPELAYPQDAHAVGGHASLVQRVG